jgi:hypothetical protein
MTSLSPLVLGIGALFGLVACSSDVPCVFCGAGDGGAVVTMSSTTTGGGGDGGTAGVGGEPMGGTGGAMSTTSETTTSTTSEEGGAGGALPAACYPLSPWGYNCAEDVCGAITNYTVPAACDGVCLEEATGLGIGLEPIETTWVLSDFLPPTVCYECDWYFAVRMYDTGCVRASVSDGLYVQTAYTSFKSPVCPPSSTKTCAYEDALPPNESAPLRIVVTVDPNNPPTVGWLRIERILGPCAGSGFGCN